MGEQIISLECGDLSPHSKVSDNFHMLTIWCYPRFDKTNKLSTGNNPDRNGPAEFI